MKAIEYEVKTDGAGHINMEIRVDGTVTTLASLSPEQARSLANILFDKANAAVDEVDHLHGIAYVGAQPTMICRCGQPWPCEWTDPSKAASMKWVKPLPALGSVAEIKALAERLEKLDGGHQKILSWWAMQIGTYRPDLLAELNVIEFEQRDLRKQADALLHAIKKLQKEE